jgi:VIT1/CCC1 family predicted Fe2+/Mn2+ transporter
MKPTLHPKNSKKREMERQGVFFGISTAIMTMLPFQVGIVMSGNSNLKEIISSIVAMSVADSLADAYGIYFSDEATDIDRKDSVVAALTAFFTKLVCQLSFILPFFIASGVKMPTIINLVWGSLVLLAATYQAAKLRGFPKIKYTLQTSLFTGLAVLVSYGVTRFVASLVK